MYMYEPGHAERSLKVPKVIVIPNEAWAHMAMLIPLLM